MKTSVSSSSLTNRKRQRLTTDLNKVSFEGASPLKSLGQNFLSDQKYRDRIVESLFLDSDTFVLELGPGRGALTQPLSKGSGKVCAVEIDRRLAQALSVAFVGTNVSIVHADALRQDFSALVDPAFKKAYFVANLPYYIATPLVVKAIIAQRFDKIFFMIQRELAERFIAVKQTKAYGAISVLLQATCIVKILFNVPRSAFIPVPGVDSCFIELVPLLQKDIDIASFSRFTRLCFSSRRKTIRNNLLFFNPPVVVDGVLLESGIDGSVRPEQLEPADFLKLFKVYSEHVKD